MYRAPAVQPASSLVSVQPSPPGSTVQWKFTCSLLPASPKLSTRLKCEQNGAQKGDREAAIDAEIARVNNLPAHSSYVIHRMKELNKLRHLSIKAVGCIFFLVTARKLVSS